jgi:hypothetical protein
MAQIINKIDVFFNNITSNKIIGDKIKKYINGTFECIKINMKNPDFDITLPIDTFSDEKIQKLFEKGIISEKVFAEELQWRKIIKDYPTNEFKLAYIMELDYFISQDKQEINNNIKKLCSFNILKNNIMTVIRRINDNRQISLLRKKYNIGETDEMAQAIHSTVVEASTVSEASTSTEGVLEQVQLPLTPVMTDMSLLVLPPMAVDINTHVPPPMTPPPMTPLPIILSQLFECKSDEQPIKKLTLSINTNTELNIAPTDIFLEKTCMYGKQCTHINNPIRCGFNHIVIGEPIQPNFSQNKIKKGSIIPKEFCKNEKLWNNQRCRNINCCYVHCVGRVNFVMKYAVQKDTIDNDLESMQTVNKVGNSRGHIRSPSYSPPPRSRDSRNRSPVSRARSRSPVSRGRSHVSRARSRSPAVLRGRYSVSRSRSPISRKRSPVSRARSPVSRKRSPISRTRSPVSHGSYYVPSASVSNGIPPVPAYNANNTSSFPYPSYPSYYPVSYPPMSYPNYTHVSNTPTVSRLFTLEQSNMLNNNGIVSQKQPHNNRKRKVTDTTDGSRNIANAQTDLRSVIETKRRQ